MIGPSPGLLGSFLAIPPKRRAPASSGGETQSVCPSDDVRGLGESAPCLYPVRLLAEPLLGFCFSKL